MKNINEEIGASVSEIEEKGILRSGWTFHDVADEIDYYIDDYIDSIYYDVQYKLFYDEDDEDI